MIQKANQHLEDVGLQLLRAVGSNSKVELVGVRARLESLADAEDGIRRGHVNAGEPRGREGPQRPAGSDAAGGAADTHRPRGRHGGGSAHGYLSCTYHFALG